MVKEFYFKQFNSMQVICLTQNKNKQKPKERQRLESFLGTEKIVKHEDDSDTDYSWRARNHFQSLGEKMNKRSEEG